MIKLYTFINSNDGSILSVTADGSLDAYDKRDSLVKEKLEWHLINSKYVNGDKAPFD